MEHREISPFTAVDRQGIQGFSSHFSMLGMPWRTSKVSSA